MITNLNPNHQPLSAKLDAFTDNDPEFKQELMVLMIQNLRELQEAVAQLLSRSQFPYFEKIVHKTKSVLLILDDHELNTVIDELKITLENSGDIVLREKINKFKHVSDNIIKYLEDEGSIQQAS
jgi:hypothetical protein